MNQFEKQFDYIKIKLASPNRIKEWGQRQLPNGQLIGEVKKAETINYRTFKPEMNGLFCERIFGPNKNLECACGKYKRVRYEGLICDRCGVEITESRVRRHRMGYINLIYPVTHIWYINSRPNYLSLLLEVEQNELRIDTGLIERYKARLNYKIIQIKKQLEHFINEKNKSKIIELKTQLKNCIQEINNTETTLKSKHVEENDEIIQSIKLASLAYFIAESEIDFYSLHWNFKSYRTFRRLNYSNYPRNFYQRNFRNTPNNLIGSVLIRNELDKLNLRTEIIKTREFIVYSSNVLEKKLPDYLTSQWFRKWEHQRIYKLRGQAVKRVRILENLLATRSNPAWIILSILPVIPPALRPMIQLEGGRFATSDLNELYRRIITRNNRLLRLLEIDAPQLIIRNEKRMLQEAVDTLIDNGKRGKLVLGANNRPLKSCLLYTSDAADE